jgi:hypothetical protein
MYIVSDVDIEEIGKLANLGRAWLLVRRGTVFECEIIADAAPDIRRGTGDTISAAVMGALADLRKAYI